MSRIAAIIGTALFAGVANVGVAQHQTQTPSGMAGSPAPSDLEAASNRAKDVERYEDYQDRAHLNSGDAAKIRAEAIAESQKILEAIQLKCEIADAAPVGRGKANLDGKKIAVNIYEVACRSGLGFLLVARGQEPPYSTSCFSAEKSHAATLTAGHKSEMYCQLAANKEVKAVAGALMATAGTSCVVSKLDWFGRNVDTHTEYTEVVCDDGRGFLIQTAQAGSEAPVTLMSCREAAQQRIKCRLTDGGPLAKPLTESTFKDLLEKRDPQCKVEQIRLMGQETKHNRYLVEAKCAAHPGGLVALIPLEDNPSPYEAMDCASAAERGVHCEFLAK